MRAYQRGRVVMDAVQISRSRDLGMMAGSTNLRPRQARIPQNLCDSGMASFVLQGMSMATARVFQDLIAWQLAMELCDVIFEITETGPAASDADFQDQIRRAAKAAPPLIAEGFLRYTPDEFVRYLRMARGELGEVQSRLEFAKRRKYFSEEQQSRACSLARRAMAATSKLLKSKLPLLKRKKASSR